MRENAGPEGDAPRISVIVPVLQTAPVLSLFLKSLVDTLPAGSQLILVDDGCGLDARAVMDSARPDLERQFDLAVIRDGHNRGDGVAFNTGLRRATNAITVRLESDAVMLGDWSKELTAPLQDPRVAAVAGVLLYPQSGGVNHAGLSFFESVARHSFLNARTDSLPVSPFPVQSMAFGFTAFRRDAVLDLGGFDGGFHQGYDDLDLALRIREAAGSLVVTTAAQAYHWELSSGPHRAAARKRNLAVFWSRWGGKIEDDLWRYLKAPLRDALASLHSQARIAAVDLHSDRIGARRFWSEAQANCQLDPFEILDLAHRASGEGAIALPLVLGADGADSPGPLIFLVDNFVRLRGNHYFFERRRNAGFEDLIVDFHSNVVFAQQLHRSDWPGDKLR